MFQNGLIRCDVKKPPSGGFFAHRPLTLAINYDNKDPYHDALRRFGTQASGKFC